MYLTILKHEEKCKVITYTLVDDHYKTFSTEEWEDFMEFNLDIDVENIEWIVHEDSPEIITVIDI